MSINFENWYFCELWVSWVYLKFDRIYPHQQDHWLSFHHRSLTSTTVISCSIKEATKHTSSKRFLLYLEFQWPASFLLQDIISQMAFSWNCMFFSSISNSFFCLLRYSFNERLEWDFAVQDNNNDDDEKENISTKQQQKLGCL